MKFKDFLNEAPKEIESPAEGVRLLQALMKELNAEGHFLSLKLRPGGHVEALKEAVHIMRKIVQGADGQHVLQIVQLLAGELQLTRKSLLPYPTRNGQLEDSGLWFEDEKISRTLAALQAVQSNVADATVIMENLHKILFVLDFVWTQIEIAEGRQNGKSTFDSAAVAFAKATFKKLGIL